MTVYSFGMVTNAIGLALDGADPVAGLVQGSDGNFYGTTSGGGTNGDGTVFKIGANGTLMTVYSFGMVTNAIGLALDGADPVSGLVQGSDGNFYGTTSGGGNFGGLNIPGTIKPLRPISFGTVFKIGTNGVLTTLYFFGTAFDAQGEALGGANPVAGLMRGTNGNFYGTTSGQYGNATVFRLTIVPEFQSLTLTNSRLNLTWSTEAGGMYQLQYTSDLTSTNWTNLGSPLPATGATLTASDSVTNAPQRFYRLALAP